jgi:hypothetical protein
MQRGLRNGAVKLILTYDPLPETREAYFQYVLGEFIPTLEHLGLSMSEAWHTAYGDYPLRLTAFIAPSLDALETILGSEVFQMLEARLMEYVCNYRRRIVAHTQQFQF